MVSGCLNGQTGPHKDYPGFGPQGAALSGYQFLTGWPDRDPIGPSGTITDSLAPRYVASLIAAALHYKRRTGHGVYLDVSQVEAAMFTLSPWLLEADATGIIVQRDGNRSRRAVPHGVFPCRDEGETSDRWVAIACWTDEEWTRMAHVMGVEEPQLATIAQRRARIDDVEALVAAWTRTRTRLAIAEQLQELGIEAVPVNDFGDVHSDPQVAHRDHFIPIPHPAMGLRIYERSGFRISGRPSGYTRSSPTLGQDNTWVQTELLGLSEVERESSPRTVYLREFGQRPLLVRMRNGEPRFCYRDRPFPARFQNHRLGGVDVTAEESGCSFGIAHLYGINDLRMGPTACGSNGLVRALPGISSFDRLQRLRFPQSFERAHDQIGRRVATQFYDSPMEASAGAGEVAEVAPLDGQLLVDATENRCYRLGPIRTSRTHCRTLGLDHAQALGQITDRDAKTLHR